MDRRDGVPGVLDELELSLDEATETPLLLRRPLLLRCSSTSSMSKPPVFSAFSTRTSARFVVDSLPTADVSEDSCIIAALLLLLLAAANFGSQGELALAVSFVALMVETMGGIP